jgi:ABC-type nitrate/sulfonate/bicarbonate transport system ATPase subunit
VKRVAVFGNAGGGKSTLARRIAELTRLPLYVVDKMQFREGGAAVSSRFVIQWTPRAPSRTPRAELPRALVMSSALDAEIPRARF